MYHGILLKQKYIHAHVHAWVQAFTCTCTLHLPTISIITKRMIPIIPANSNHNYSKEWKYNCREVIHTQYIHSQISHETSYNTCSWYNIIQDTCTSSTHVHVLYMYCTCTWGWHTVHVLIKVAFDQPILPKGQILTCMYMYMYMTASIAHVLVRGHSLQIKVFYKHSMLPCALSYVCSS